MKFSIKIFIWTVLVVAVAFSAGGYLLISRNFSANVDRETRRASEEHLALRFMLESGIISEELRGSPLTDAKLSTVASEVAQNLQQGRGIVLSNGQGMQLYSNAPEGAAGLLGFQAVPSGQTRYHIERVEGRYYLLMTGLFAYDSVPLYLSYVRDISDVFAERDVQIKDFMLYDVAIVVTGAVVVFLISWLLTRPIRRLTFASSRIARGDYSQRAQVRSSDEIGELTRSFNRMAGSVEDKIHEMEDAARRKDEFVANFTHELKTPMTSIIGYADMLRSRDCDRQTVFTAAQYIFSEGRRLESLSLKMLDLLLLDKQEFVLKPVDGPELLDYIAQSVAASFAQDGVSLSIDAAPGTPLAEPDLIRTVLINLADNARKASERGSVVELAAVAQAGRYTISVTDHGKGIPEKELGRITEAFYKVDKSRARAQHGAGLGLAIASRIAVLHGTELNIRSIVGLGTCVSISLTLHEGEDEHEE